MKRGVDGGGMLRLLAVGNRCHFFGYSLKLVFVWKIFLPSLSRMVRVTFGILFDQSMSRVPKFRMFTKLPGSWYLLGLFGA